MKWELNDKLELLVGAFIAMLVAMAGMTILGVAPWAHALPGPTMTVQQFLNNMRLLGWSGTNAELLHDGALICGWRDVGYDEDDARHKLYMSDAVPVEASQANLLATVFAAEDTFCWWYAK